MGSIKNYFYQLITPKGQNLKFYFETRKLIYFYPSFSNGNYLTINGNIVFRL